MVAYWAFLLPSSCGSTLRRHRLCVGQGKSAAAGRAATTCSKNAQYATMSPAATGTGTTYPGRVSDPCCGRRRRGWRKGDNCRIPDLWAISDTGTSRASLLTSTRAQSCIRTKTRMSCSGNQFAAHGTFTNDPGAVLTARKWVTLPAGESGPDARAEKASAAPAKPTRDPHEAPRKSSTRPQTVCNAVDGE